MDSIVSHVPFPVYLQYYKVTSKEIYLQVQSFTELESTFIFSLFEFV